MNQALDAALTTTTELLRESGEVVEEIQEDGVAAAVAGLAPLLRGKLLDHALNAVLAFKRPSARATALTALAQQLTGKRRHEVVEHALDAASTSVDAEQRISILRDGGGQIEGERARGLQALAPLLTGKLLERALNAAMAMEWYRADVLIDIAQQSTGKHRLKALKYALEAALALRAEARAFRLADLAPLLTGKLLEDTLDAALEVEDGLPRVQVLAVLVPRLPGEQRLGVLKRALNTSLTLRESQQASALYDLEPLLTGKLLKRALEAVLLMKQKKARLRRLVTEGAGPEIFALLAWMPPEISLLGEPFVGSLLGRALDIALTSCMNELRTGLLITMPPKLKEELLERAAALWERRASIGAIPTPLIKEYASELGKESIRLVPASYTASLAPYVSLIPPKVWQNMVKPAVPPLPREILKPALEALLVLKQEKARVKSPAAEDWWAEVLMDPLASSQQPKVQFYGLLEQTLDITLALWLDEQQARLLVDLTPQLKKELLRRALDAVPALRKKGRYRIRALTTEAPLFMGEPSAGEIEQILQSLEAEPALMEEFKRAVRQAEYLSQVVNQNPLLKLVRQAMVNALWKAKDWPRQNVFERRFIYNLLFSPPMLSSETLGTIASDIIEICEEWQWL